MRQLMCSVAILALMLGGAACSADRAQETKDDLRTFGEEVKGTAGEAVDDTKAAAGKAGAKTKAATRKAGAKTKAAAEKAGAATKEGASKTGEVITDAWITTKVKTQLMAADGIKGTDIDVDTNNHVVTLSGTAPSAVARVRAYEIAQETEGVTRVVNRMKIAK